jgi:hypothetical protein
VVGQDAGFTDTRIIFLWLKTHTLFYKIPIKILKLTDCVSKYELYELCMKKQKNKEEYAKVIYSSEPRIGKK